MTLNFMSKKQKQYLSITKRGFKMNHSIKSSKVVYPFFAIVLLALTLLISPNAAFAQGGLAKQKGKDKEKPHLMLKEKLGLTDEQIEKLRPILEEQRTKMQDLRREIKADMEKNMEPYKEKFNQIHDETLDKASTVLTKEQMEKFKEWQNENRDKIKERLTERKGKGRK